MPPPPQPAHQVWQGQVASSLLEVDVAVLVCCPRASAQQTKRDQLAAHLKQAAAGAGQGQQQEGTSEPQQHSMGGLPERSERSAA